MARLAIGDTRFCVASSRQANRRVEDRIAGSKRGSQRRGEWSDRMSGCSGRGCLCNSLTKAQLGVMATPAIVASGTVRRG